MYCKNCCHWDFSGDDIGPICNLNEGVENFERDWIYCVAERYKVTLHTGPEFGCVKFKNIEEK